MRHEPAGLAGCAAYLGQHVAQRLQVHGIVLQHKGDGARGNHLSLTPLQQQRPHLQTRHLLSAQHETRAGSSQCTWQARCTLTDVEGEGLESVGKYSSWPSSLGVSLLVPHLLHILAELRLAGPLLRGLGVAVTLRGVYHAGVNASRQNVIQLRLLLLHQQQTGSSSRAATQQTCVITFLRARRTSMYM